MPGLCALQYIFTVSDSYMHGVNLSPEMMVSFIAYHNILSHTVYSFLPCLCSLVVRIDTECKSSYFIFYNSCLDGLKTYGHLCLHSAIAR